MSLHFLGAAGTVTGSRYLLRPAQQRVLVDCGLFQGYKKLRLRNWEEPPFDPRSDRCGAADACAPGSFMASCRSLVKRGFRGKIRCSEATYESCKLLLADSAHLQEEEAEYANRHRLSKHQPALPLYDGRDAARALQQFDPVPEHRALQIVPGLDAQWIPNGHILGSCAIACDVDGIRLLFSGDLGRPQDIMMISAASDRSAKPITWWSNRPTATARHAGRPAQQLQDDHQRAPPRAAASSVMPAFAVGRAQTAAVPDPATEGGRRNPATCRSTWTARWPPDATDIYRAHRAANADRRPATAKR